MKTSTFLLGVAAGSIAAAVTVLFSTPQSGNELRSSVKNASVDMKEKFKDVKVKIDSLKESVSHLTKEAKETVPAAIEGIKHSVDKWQQATEPNKDRLENEIAAIQKALEELEQTIATQQK
jgi:gas vesicle protein